MLKLFLAFTLTTPLFARCQSYADSPFYKAASPFRSDSACRGVWPPGASRQMAWSSTFPGSVPLSSPRFDEIRGS